MCVDANVLVYERIKENFLNKSDDPRNSGFNSAFITILDSNLTTLFAAVFLFAFGFGPIRGFSISLIIGIFSSLIVPIPILKLFLERSVCKHWSQNKMTRHFSKYRKLSYMASSFLIVMTILFIFFKGLNLGIDFKGGFNVEVRSDLSNQELTNIFSRIDTSREVIVKKEISSNVYSVRIESGIGDKLFLDSLRESVSTLINIEILMSEYIEPTFSSDLIQNAIYALLSSIFVIALYIWIRFDWQFAFAGILALLHDVFISIGFMSIFNIEFNLTMIAAILLIAGYSINDTIVLFDRLRTLSSEEDVKINLPSMINKSIILNLRRTILTSFTTILALICLVILAPVNLTEMPIVFIFGVLIGTYSSIFLGLPIIHALNYESVLKSRDS